MRTCICSKSINVKCATALTEVVMFKTRVSDTAEPIIPTHNCLPDDRCLHVALLVMALLGMSTKPVTTRATTVSRSGCVQRGLGWKRLVKGLAAEMLLKMTHDPAYSS